MAIIDYLFEQKVFKVEGLEFEEGDCNVYAVAMYRKYGYPIYAVKGYFEDDGVEGVVVSHVFVKTPDGVFKDASGEYTSRVLRDKRIHLKYSKCFIFSSKWALVFIPIE